MDVSNPNSIDACVEKIKKEKIHFDVLVNNAGISLVPEYRQANTGYELTFQTNFLGPAYLTECLLEYIVKESCEPRVVFVNSCTYPKGRPSEISKEHIMPTKEDYSNFGSYFRSKYCITSYCLTMARKHPECHFVVCDPGTAATSIARDFGCLGWLQSTRFMKWLHPADRGAINIAYCAMAEETAKTGVIVYEEKEQEPIDAIKSEEEQDKIYAITHELFEEGKKRAASQKNYACLFKKHHRGFPAATGAASRGPSARWRSTPPPCLSRFPACSRSRTRGRTRAASERRNRRK